MIGHKLPDPSLDLGRDHPVSADVRPGPRDKGFETSRSVLAQPSPQRLRLVPHESDVGYLERLSGDFPEVLRLGPDVGLVDRRSDEPKPEYRNVVPLLFVSHGSLLAP